MAAELNYMHTSTLDVAYEESGAVGGVPIFLMHGWPYDPRCYDDVMLPLVAAGCRVIVPSLRGFGSTRFLSAATPRWGQEAALGNDLRELMDALAVERALLAGYDWGGRAACIVSALWPQRVRGLVTVNGYNILDIAGSMKPQAPAQERRFWYQWYFQSERAAPGSKPIAAAFAACSGNCSRRIGGSMTPPSSAARPRSTIRVLSPPLCQRGGRSGTGRDRATAGGQAQDRGAHDRASRRRRRRPAAGGVGKACRVIHWAVSAPRLAEDRS
jgi:pimeloyl-ACP methyl ester carboxylesterase